MNDQAIIATTIFEADDKVWVINPDKSKSQPEKISPYTILKVNHDTNTYIVQDFKGKHKHYHADSLCLCKSRNIQRESNLQVPADLLKRYQARITNPVPKL